MHSRRFSFACWLAAACVATETVAAQSDNHLVTYGGASDGLLGVVIDRNRQTPFLGVEVVTRADNAFHWTFGLAHARLTTPNSCCGPTPTLSYHYHAYLPTVGLAHDVPIGPVYVRTSAAVGPAILRQSRTGTPPPYLSDGAPSWQWDYLHTALGASLHCESRNGWGVLAGTRMHNQLSPWGGLSESQMAPHVGFSWIWPRSAVRETRSGVPGSPRTHAAAQAVDTSAAARRARALASFPRRAPIRVETHQQTFEGRLGAIRSDTLIITNALADTVPIANIVSIWRAQRRVGRSTLRGALWGAGISAAIAAAATAAEEDCDYCINDPAAAALIFAIPGSVAGALVGHVIGWLHRPWRRVYP